MEAIQFFTKGVGWEIAAIDKIPPKFPREGQAKWSTRVTLTDNQVYKAGGIFGPNGVIMTSWLAVSP